MQQTASTDMQSIAPVPVNKTLVVYHYFERDAAYIENIKFFIDRALRADVDFVFLIAGGCSVELPIADNVQIKHLSNNGSDFASYSEFLDFQVAQSYQYFVFVNCTMIGPFFAQAISADWTKLLTSLLSGDVKLVGTTINILPEGPGIPSLFAQKFGGVPPFPHVQSMLFATDNDCLTFLLEKDFFRSVSLDRNDVIASSEIRLSSLIIEKGWNISCLMHEYQGLDYRTLNVDINPTSIQGDPWFDHAYFGRSLHPYETLFWKSNRQARQPAEIESLVCSQRRLGQSMSTSQIDRALASVVSAWKGHKNFARWIVKDINARCVVDLGVDFGFSTICFAESHISQVYGIDSFEGDEQAGLRNTFDQVTSNLRELGLSNAHLIKGYFSDVAKQWMQRISILHIDGLHDYESVARDYNAWRGFVRSSGVISFMTPAYLNLGSVDCFRRSTFPKLISNIHSALVLSRKIKVS